MCRPDKDDVQVVLMQEKGKWTYQADHHTVPVMESGEQNHCKGARVAAHLQQCYLPKLVATD